VHGVGDFPSVLVVKHPGHLREMHHIVQIYVPPQCNSAPRGIHKMEVFMLGHLFRADSTWTLQILGTVRVLDTDFRRTEFWCMSCLTGSSCPS
jgi:hypothetical protein